MKCCECGSFAINIDPKRELCDVCYFLLPLVEIWDIAEVQKIEKVKKIITEVDLKQKMIDDRIQRHRKKD